MPKDDGISWKHRKASEDLSGGAPLVPAIWPLGLGVVMVRWGYEPTKGLGLYFLRGVRDELIGEAGGTPPEGAWEDCEGAPTLCLAFNDVDAVMRHIESMEKLIDMMQEGQVEEGQGDGQ